MEKSFSLLSYQTPSSCLCLTMKHHVWMKASEHFSPKLKNLWIGHCLYTSDHNAALYKHTTRDPRSDLVWAISYLKAAMLFSLLVRLQKLARGIHAGNPLCHTCYLRVQSEGWISAEHSEKCSTTCQVDPVTWLSHWAWECMWEIDKTVLFLHRGFGCFWGLEWWGLCGAQVW